MKGSPRMKFKSLIKAFLIHTCIYTTVAFGASMIFIAACGMTSFAVPTYFLVLAFCAFFAMANAVFAHSGLSIWWRSILHAILTLGGFYLCIYSRYADIGMNRDALLLFSVLMTLLYGACMGTFLAVRYARLRKKEQKAYQSQFSSPNNKDQKRR
ncbi:MAG: hypothetical protein IJF08_02170 [Clostridia bacterium]|nr:hypothetical protein [Clostridia bacterium]